MARDLDLINGSGAARSVLEGLKEHKDLAVPVAIAAAGAFAASAGPKVIRGLSQSVAEKSEREAEKLGEKAAESAKSGLGDNGLTGKGLSKLTGGSGGSGGKKTRRLPIQRWTDVAVPVEKAYQAWTTFDQYPTFMHRVVSVEQKDEDKISWQEKIWFSSRQWEGRITDRRKNDRIAWKTTSGMSHKGVVSFHKLDDSLTRVMVDMEFEPNGMIEKMASGLRFVKRAIQSDLARFKAYVEMQDAKGIEYRPKSEADESTSRERKSENERKSAQEKPTSRNQRRRTATGS